MVVLEKVSIENFLEQEVLYSKLVRGKLDFKVETHMLDGGKKLQVYLYRNHPRIEEFIAAATAKNMLGKQHCEVNTGLGVLRLTINDQRFMINNGGVTNIVINELNFNTKELSIQDFPKGKVAILIDFNFEEEADNAKFKKEIKDMFAEEDNNETTSIRPSN
jgi:hypothetical protein